MRYPEFLSSAKRHNQACKVILEKIDFFAESQTYDKNFVRLVATLYYLSGYIVECSLKFKIFEAMSYNAEEDINESSCLELGVSFNRRIKTHSFSRLQDTLSSLITDISHESEDDNTNILLSNWSPEIRYKEAVHEYEDIKRLYNHSHQFLRRI